MAKQHNTNTVFLCIILFHAFCMSSELAGEQPQAVYIFGDSLVDVGTNNYVEGSLATANNPFYGIDYPNSIATGRFSNGYNIADYIVKLIGVCNQSPPPFLQLVQSQSDFQSNIQLGVNFASGGAGILDESGFQAFNNVIPFNQQLQQFKTVGGNLTEALGADKAAALISKSLYIISIGNNDLNGDFLFPPQNTSVQQFIANLMAAYAKQLKTLYDMGAIKFGIIGVAAIGSWPASLSRNGGVPNETMNEAARSFQASTLTLLQSFSSQNPGVHYSLGNFYDITMAAIKNPSAYGFRDVEDACCGEGPNNGINKCKPSSNICTNRDAYLYFDLFHPTQKAAKIVAQFLVAGGKEFVAPINFRRLAAIQV